MSRELWRPGQSSPPAGETAAGPSVELSRSQACAAHVARSQQYSPCRIESIVLCISAVFHFIPMPRKCKLHVKEPTVIEGSGLQKYGLGGYLTDSIEVQTTRQ